MKRERKTYHSDFKLKVVQLCKVKERKIASVAEELNVDEKVIYSWINKYDKHGENCFNRYGKYTDPEQNGEPEDALNNSMMVDSYIVTYFKEKELELLSNEEKYRFIKNHKPIFKIETMCSLLDVNFRNYHKWNYTNEVKEKIRFIYLESNESHGCATITNNLIASGYNVAETLVAKYMKEMGFKGKRGRSKQVLQANSKYKEEEIKIQNMEIEDIVKLKYNKISETIHLRGIIRKKCAEGKDYITRVRKEEMVIVRLQ